MKCFGNFLCALGTIWLAQTSTAQLPSITQGNISVELQSVASGLSSPVDLVSAHDGTGRLFIVEQSGRVRILNNGTVSATPFLDIRSRTLSGGEQGLLGLAFHPGFTNSASPGFRKLYTYSTESPSSGLPDYTVPMSGSPASHVVIAEWKVSTTNPDLVDTTTRREVLRIEHPQSNHNAGKIAFRPSDGFLYIAIGDGGGGNDTDDGHTLNLGNGQDLSRLLGKILRIDPLSPSETPGSTDPVSARQRYRIPASNPFVNAAGLDEIYAYGFRNPFRFSFDVATNQLIVGDVGQNKIEEVDVIEAGKNYGWNRKEGSFVFHPNDGSVTVDPNPDPALTNPVLEYDHGDGISVIGGYIYRGAAIGALAGKYVFGDYLLPSLGSGRLFYGDLASGSIQELLIGLNPRPLGLVVKAFGMDDFGELYVVLDNSNNSAGQISKLVPIPATPALLNLSTRARVEDDDGGTVIAGFIIRGSVPKTIILRARGPSLNINGQPLSGRLTNPTLALLDAGGNTVDANDDWMTHPRRQELVAYNLAPSDNAESALVATLQPGAYTATMRGVNGGTGIGLIELYDPNTSESGNAVNLSTRGRVQSGDNVMIAGLIIGGNTSQRAIIRAIGPSLTAQGVSGALPNPMLEIVDSNGNSIASNDNWRSDQQTEINATGLAPTNDAESAIVRTFAPGSYTAIVRGSGNTSGVALVEVYRLAP